MPRKLPIRPTERKPDYVYLLQHGFGKYGDERIKLIGIFDSRNVAIEARKSLKPKPGFRLSKGRFSLDRIKINQIHWSEGFGGV
jgi:hypothetical protein